METNYSVLLIALISLFVVGMAIFLMWKLLEPIREGESRALTELVAKPAAAMAGGVVFIGVCMIYPPVLIWTFVVLAIFAVVAYFRMPVPQKAAMAKAVDKPDPTSRWSTARLILAVVFVFAAVAGLLVFFAPQ
jgi:hypothetical protein